MAAAHIRTRRRAAGAALSAGLLMATLTATLTGAARQPTQPTQATQATQPVQPAQPAPAPPAFPVQAAFSPTGPYATTTGTATDGSAVYDLYYPSSYAALGFQSPIVTWGNGTGGSPAQVSVLLRHLASYGFTVIASTLPNTGKIGRA